MNPFRRRKATTNPTNNNNNSNATSSGGGASAATAAGGSSGAVTRSRGRRARAPQSSAPPPSTSASTAPTTSSAPLTPFTCHTCNQPIPRTSRHIHTSRSLSGQRRYHRECFVCLHCCEPIDPQGQSFCYARLNKNEGSAHSGVSGGNGLDNEGGGDSEHPFHRECFAHHFGWMCVVCEKPLPMVTKVNPPADGNSNTNNGGGNIGAAGSDGGNAGPAASGGGGGSKSTKVEFLKHPFFEKERMCPHHARPAVTTNNNASGPQQILDDVPNNNNNNTNDNNLTPFSNPQNPRDNPNDTLTTTSTTEDHIGEIRRCAGCHRFEPLFASSSKHFIDVGDKDTGRCVCLACCRTVVTGNDDVIPLWEKVINFFEGPLGLLTSEDSHQKNITGVTRRDLESIPVMVVGMEALNDNMKQRQSESSHFGSQQIMTRGLCLSEHTPASPLEKNLESLGAGMSGGRARGTNCDCIQGVGCIGVTAILCLSGLPADLTASILAHEATHAWIKLHPNFPYTTPLPLRVEEGLCQLVAFLFLNDGLDPIPKEESFSSELSSHHLDSSSRAVRGGAPQKEEADDSIPSDEKLRQYFRFCIETDEGVYGEGFRLAARAYAKIGIEELFYHVALHRDFPEL